MEEVIEELGNNVSAFKVLIPSEITKKDEVIVEKKEVINKEPLITNKYRENKGGTVEWKNIILPA